MSGSGRGGGGGGGYADDVIACEELVIETNIASPVPAVVAKIDVGALLGIELRRVGGTETIVLTFNGEDAGGVISPKAQRLRECLRAGTRYTAKVHSKPGPSTVLVRISPIRT